jgi:hypothetical protein
MKIDFYCIFLMLTFNCCAQKNPVSIKLKENDIFWKTGYPNLPFWDSTFSYNGGKGYLDTFIIMGNHFRVIHNDTSYDGSVEIYKNRQWTTNLVFENLGNHNKYDRTKDVNLDGFTDLIWFRKWETEVFLFNPKLRRFEDTSFNHPEIWTLIDKDKKIFCDFWEHFYVEENHSKLYTFENNKLKVLFYLKYISDEPRGMEIKKVALYKNSNSKTEIKIKEIEVNADEFDYISFWKSNYKQLISSNPR